MTGTRLGRTFAVAMITWTASRTTALVCRTVGLASSGHRSAKTVATSLWSSTTATPTDAVERERRREGDSDRLGKARRLLEEYQKDAGRSSAMTDDAADAVVDDDVVRDDDNVPETYWTNGHLLDHKVDDDRHDNDVVTRWANGAKIAEPITRYDPVAAERLLFRQPAKWVVRNARIAAPLALWAAGVVGDYVAGREPRNRPRRARQLLRVLTGLGPAIIKAGQALASRPDLLPSEYLAELQRLQDDVPTYDSATAFRIVEEELGRDFADVFELVDPRPVAAASIGQVYRARLVSNGDPVALKIQRPNCEEVVALDLYVLRWWSGVATWSLTNLLGRPDVDVRAIIDDFGELIYRELDYVAEAANGQRFSELYAGVDDVFVPKVYGELTTRRVLTMEWVDGYRLTDTENLRINGLDRKKLVDTLIQCSLRQILENGFFHADPHAGNLLACPDGRLCYLDFGMMSFAGTSQRNGFLLAVVHIVNRDWSELVRLYQRLGFIPDDADLLPIEIALEQAMPDVLSADVSELNFKNIVGSLGDIFYDYPFALPPFYIAIIRCLGVLEGLALQVDPGTRVIDEAYPYVAGRVLTDDQDELREAFRRLAFHADGRVRWERLEGLLERARGAAGYDVTVALDRLANFLISEDGEEVLEEVADRLVEGADRLGTETITYVVEASRALLEEDEAGVARAWRAAERTFAEANEELVSEELRDALPAPSETMVRFWRAMSLLGDRVAGDGASSSSSSSTDPSRFVPLLRKFGQEPRVQRVVRDVVARLGERTLRRSLRAAFGLPAPVFDENDEERRRSGGEAATTTTMTKTTTSGSGY